MTAAELIAELQKHPASRPVRVVMRSVYNINAGLEEPLCENDAAEADEVRNEGAFVLIWGGKP